LRFLSDALREHQRDLSAILSRTVGTTRVNGNERRPEHAVLRLFHPVYLLTNVIDAECRAGKNKIKGAVNVTAGYRMVGPPP
jgi:hypothetical protein